MIVFLRTTRLLLSHLPDTLRGLFCLTNHCGMVSIQRAVLNGLKMILSGSNKTTVTRRVIACIAVARQMKLLSTTTNLIGFR